MKKYFLILFTTVCFGQSSIVASGNSTYTIGETFPIMQTDMKDVEVSLSVPKWEVPIEKPKAIIKKKSGWQKFFEAIKNLFK